MRVNCIKISEKSYSKCMVTHFVYTINKYNKRICYAYVRIVRAR